MSDDELKLSRRLFLQHAAAATAVSASFYSIALKTDAIAQGVPTPGPNGDRGDGMPYPYHEP
jgi:hypothetical protein